MKPRESSVILLAAIASMLFACSALCQQVSSTPEPPDRLITFGPNSWTSPFHSRPQDHAGYINVQREVIDIWAVLTYYWPEIAIVAFMLAGTICLWRLLRRRRTPGEPYCRRCNYRLTGGDTKKCPECGTALSGRNRVIGKRIRFKLAATTLIMVGVPVPLLFGVWSQRLPRHGAFTEWVDWSSMSLHDYAAKHKLQWLTAHARTVQLILEVDLATGETLRVVHDDSLGWYENLLIDADGSDIFTVSCTPDLNPPEAWDVRVVQIDAASGGVRRSIPIGRGGWPLQLVGYDDMEQTLYVLSSDELLSTVNCSTGEVSRFANCSLVLPIPPAKQRLVVGEADGDVLLRAGPNSQFVRNTYKVSLWDAPTRSVAASLGESIPIGALAASGDGKRLYAAVYGKGVQIWNLERPEQAPWIVTKDGPARSLDQITISPDGRYLFAIHSDPMGMIAPSIHIFDLELLKWVGERAVPPGSGALELSVSGDGKFLVANCYVQTTFGAQLAIYELEDLAPSSKDGAWAGFAQSPPDVDATDDTGRTALHAAAEIGDLRLARILIANGADIGARADAGVTPLHIAMEHGRWAVAELLLEKGADVEAVTDNGDTATELARRRDDLDNASTRLIESLEDTANSASLADTPTAQMIHRLAAGAISTEAAADELIQRIMADQLEESDYSLLFDLCVAGNEAAPPLSEPWKLTFGKILSATLQGPIGADSMGDAIQKLYDAPLDVTLRSRDPWPIGVPLYVQAFMHHWWPYPTGHRVYVTPRLPNAETTWLVGSASPIVLPITEPMDGEITFDVGIDQFRQAEPNADWTTVQQRTVTIPVRIAGTIDDVLTPVESEEMDRILQDNLSYEVGDGWITCTPSLATEIPLFEGVAIGVVMEFVLDGEVMATELHWWLGGAEHPPHDRQWGWTKKSPWLAQSGEVWTIRIHSDPEIALRVIDADRYWSGEITIPLTVRK